MTPPTRTPEAIIEALRAFPDDLYRLVNGQSMDALLRPSRDGGWGVVEILPHLRDWEEIYLGRIEAITEHDAPSLPIFDDELWAIERDYRGQDPHETLSDFRELRERLLSHLDADDAEQWNRVGMHGAYGEITLHWLLDRIADHDAEHLEQIRDALA